MICFRGPRLAALDCIPCIVLEEEGVSDQDVDGELEEGVCDLAIGTKVKITSNHPNREVYRINPNTLGADINISSSHFSEPFIHQLGRSHFTTRY